MTAMSADAYISERGDAAAESTLKGKEYMRLYQKGLSDKEIAIEVYGDEQKAPAIRAWRAAAGLGVNQVKKESAKKSKKIYSETKTPQMGEFENVICWMLTNIYAELSDVEYIEKMTAIISVVNKNRRSPK